MHIYDSVLKQKVEFSPIKDNEVKIYLCGPTVYDDAHLGHAKSAISFDLLRRVLILSGYKVTFARNFTDIDDKILKKMQDENKSLEEITNHYINSYLSDMDSLNILRADIEPKATQTIKEIIEYIEILLKNNYAYCLDDGVYFDTSKDQKYLSLSQKTGDEENIARVSSNSNKKNEKDFALWKFDENYYDASFGKGRPGWHTECVAMINKHLAHKDGKYCIDIHAGGMDLLFPHHENEASQCRCAQKMELAKYWMHNGFVQINNNKMSKSLGNGFLIKTALNLVSGEVLRYYLQSSHYRANFNFSDADLLESKKRLDKIYRLKKRLYGVKTGEINKEFKNEILKSLNDDLNISQALASIDLMVNSANEMIDKNPKDKAYKSQIVANLEFIKEALGILYMDEFEYFQFGLSKDEKNEIEKLINQRSEAKKNKDFALADEIRQKLLDMKISIMDMPDKTLWERL